MVNKKGFIGDLFIFMIVAFILALCCGIMLYVANTTYSEVMDNVDIFQGTMNENATTIIQDTFGAVPRAFQSLKWITTMLIVGMFLSILILSYLVRTRPIFLVPYILIWIISIIVAVPLSNAYEVVYETPELVGTFSGFWGQTVIMLNLPVWMAIIGGIAGIVMFVNFIRQSQYGGYE